MEVYLLKVNASLIVFYLCYKLFFQRDTLWNVRRYYLLAGVLFSFVYPLVSMQGWLEKQEPIMAAIASIQLDEFVISPDGMVKPSIFTLENVLWSIFGIVAIFMLVRIIVQLVSIFRQRLKGEAAKLYGVDIIRIREKLTPFSFFKWIFINPEMHSPSETAEILEHEQTHARQWHSLDVIIGQLQTLLCWFNPASWLLEREIRFNLEYLADNQVIKSGFEPKKYQYHLLSLTYEPADSKLANNFNVLPIKKRIKMMNSKKTKKSGLLKYALIIPVALAMLIVSNMQDMMASAVQNQDISTEILIPADNTAIPEVQNLSTDDKIFDVVEVLPEFPGGNSAMFKYLSENIKYPVEAQQKKIQGRVTCQFIVNKEGAITDVKVIRSVDKLLDDEAVRVIKAMPNWKPGKQKGKAVNVRYTLPVQFSLFEKDGKNNSAITTLTPASKSKSSTIIDGPDENGVYDIVEEHPEFPGGEDAMYKFLAQTIKYPVIAQENRIQGRVIVQFIVEDDGSIKNPIVKRGVDPSLDNEALRIINGMPKWKPGKMSGKNVATRYTLPIQFKLSGGEGKKEKTENDEKNSADEIIVVGFGAGTPKK